MKDELVFMESWRKEEQEVGMTGLQKTLEVMKDIMNSICDFLSLTMESVDDFNGVLPTLDLSLWVRWDNKTMFNALSCFNATARRHQKLLAKGNWFKKRKSPEDDEDQPEQSSSLAKR